MTMAGGGTNQTNFEKYICSLLLLGPESKKAKMGCLTWPEKSKRGLLYWVGWSNYGYGGYLSVKVDRIGYIVQINTFIL